MSTNNSGIKPIMLIVIAAIIIAVVVFMMYFVDVDQTQETKLPEVDVNVTEGKLPEFEVKTGEVNVGTKIIEVEVPTVEVVPASD